MCKDIICGIVCIIEKLGKFKCLLVGEGYVSYGIYFYY